LSCKELTPNFEQCNPGPISVPPLRLSSAGTNGGSTPSEPTYPDTMAVDPQVLWLPPDRIGQAVDDPELLFKVGLSLIFFGLYIVYTIPQIVVNALALEGINGYEFYQHLKKDRKEVSNIKTKTNCISIFLLVVRTKMVQAAGVCGEFEVIFV